MPQLPYYYVRIGAGVYAERPNRRNFVATLTKIVPTRGVRLPALGVDAYKGFDRADNAANRARLDAEG